ncbi:hypothetical protein ILUMI_20644 [Ignelater luminosus]|uniref:Saccharopine dehydrogenase NADP binding domain-containing protein n=1 Tax=Ignelater luminosus TaxID=2038154 RepID=A0A8K0G4C6_IGNLU|nr:hypothetical protein ILUMI_20644 [Ignelater luminosus]
MANRLDIVLFGASGFTGRYCIEEIHRLSKANGKSLTWGIAGRSHTKLKQALDEYQKKTDDDLNSVPIILADAEDYISLKQMTERARILINCCGPYRFYGEPTVKACLESGTHQVDVTGEPQYMETIQLKYHKAAQEKGIYIISSCGFDTIPADLGVIFVQKNFKGTLNSVETYSEGGEDPPKTPGPYATYATWESAIHGIAHASELRDLRRKLYPTRLPDFRPRLKPRASVHKSDVINTWCVPFLGSDRSVISRTQRYLYERNKTRPVQIQTYMGFDSLIHLFLMVVLVRILSFLVKYEFGRNLLLKYPRFFSAGMFAREDPLEQKLKRIKCSITFYGKGWSEKLAEGEDEYTTPPNKTIIGRVSGVNPGYGITCTAVTLAAIVVLTEQDKLPEKGGVYSPGAAFAETTLIEQLQENGLSFEIVSSD